MGAAASAEVANCATDDGVAMVANSMLPNLMEPATGASHDDWCKVANCGAVEGNTLFMALGTCLMDNLNYDFKKCYDENVEKIFFMMIIIGGGSFVASILLFTIGWCLCCRNKTKIETEV